MKVDQEINIKTMLQEAKMFVADFDEAVSNFSEEDIKQYRENISENH